jgi:hypothetical protein
MLRYCKRCKLDLNIPELTEEEKLEIWSIKDQSMLAIKAIMDFGNLNLKEAKAIETHINEKYGQCNRCNKSDLVSENVECPKCKAFNLNWQINQSFNEEFCTHLEYRLGESFGKSSSKKTEGFWCDGVSWTPANSRQLSKKCVNNERKIETIAWIGKSGQEAYYLTIEFGNRALRRYAEGSSLEDCIPSSDTADWIEIDEKNKKMKVKLN